MDVSLRRSSMGFPWLASVLKLVRISSLASAPDSGSEADVVESQDNMDDLLLGVSERVVDREVSLGVEDLAGEADPEAEEPEEAVLVRRASPALDSVAEFRENKEFVLSLTF